MNAGMAPLALYMDAFMKCSTIEQVWALHAEKMKEYGFDRMIFGSTRFRTHGSFGDVMDALILTNHDSNYVDLFFGKEMYLYAPMATWAASNVGVMSWQWAKDRRERGLLSSEEEQLLGLNEKMGVSAGYSISFEVLSQRNKAAIGLCAQPGMTQSDVDKAWQISGSEIVMLNNLLNLKIDSLPNSGGRKPMTHRQREVLQWVADGKTVQDVSTIMGLRPVTVEKHLRLARENLNVDTTAQAIMKATVQNQFYLFEDVGNRPISAATG